MSVFDSLRAMEKELEELHHKMADLDPADPEWAAAADRAHHIDSEFRNRDGYAIEAQVGTVLDGLGFRKEDWPRRTEEFSGGWQMRTRAGRSCCWKNRAYCCSTSQRTISTSKPATGSKPISTTIPARTFLISHDRYFLDVTVKKTVEVWNKHVPLLHRQLRQVPGAENRASRSAHGRVPQSARACRTTGSVHQSLFRRAGDQGEAGSIAHQRAGQNRAHRKFPPDEQTIHFKFPQPKPSGRISRRIQGCQQKLRLEIRLRRCELRHRTR